MSHLAVVECLQGKLMTFPHEGKFTSSHFSGRKRCLPRGPCETSRCLAANIDSHCLAAIFASQLPSPKLSLKMPPKLPLPHKRGHFSSFKTSWTGPSAESCQGFLLISFGGFCRGFSWRISLGTFFPQKMRKNPATKSAKTSGGSKIKIREKSILPKSDPKISPVVSAIAQQLSGKNCLAAIFASRHQDASPGSLGLP